jgi:predicted ATPase/DNA-binding winged helix-turn-helix (wHTH) protein
MNERAVSFGPFSLLAEQRLLLKGDRQVRLGSRAFDILVCLVERAGGVVGKEQLMARAWPTMSVEESNLKIQISALRRAIGDGHGDHRYIVTVPGRGYSFVATVRRELPLRPPVATTIASAPTNNLPFAATRMIGRDDNVTALLSLLSRQRLVTIVGPGGIGKTTLAVATAEQMAHDFQRVCFVELASVRDQALVASALASALDLPTVSNEPLPSVIASLKEQNALIVLDNCEHVIDEAASLADDVLGGARSIRILATSREPLRIAAETVHHLTPLDIPAATLTAEQAFAYPAVELFMERARANSDGFNVTEPEVPVVIEICRRLDGIPLAIELAAATVDLFGVRDLSARLDKRFTLLTMGQRTALPRHRTLRATLDWSYEILSSPEQATLRALSVFQGPFTLDGANAVATVGEPGSFDVIEIVHTLVSKSLVNVDLGGSTALLRLLDSTRAYALEKLQRHGEFEAAARRHAVFCCDYLEKLEEAWPSLAPEDKDNHSRQVDNIRAAVEWAFSSGGDDALGAALTVAAVPFLLHFSLVEECAVTIRRLLTGDRATRARTRRQEMKLFWGLASAILQTQMAPAAVAAWRSASEIATELDDSEYRFRTLWGLWSNSYMFGELADALDASRQLATRMPGNTPQADQLVGERMLGFTLHVMGDHGSALRHIDHMLEHYVAPPDRSHLVRYQFDQKVTAQAFKSRVLWVRGLPEQAVRLAVSTVAAADAIGHIPSLFYALASGACPVSALIEDDMLAHRFIDRVLDVSVTPSWTSWADCYRGALLIQQNRTDGPGYLDEALKRLYNGSLQQLHSWFLGMLARGLMTQGELGGARDTIQKALDKAEHRRERWCEPELLRIKAEVTAALGHRDGAEALFQQSLALAQQQGAQSWELRTATGLARLLLHQGRAGDAIARLRPIYDRFTEGFGTADLIAAKQLLNDLEDSGSIQNWQTLDDSNVHL